MHLAMIAVEQDEDERAEAHVAASLTFFRDLGDHSQIVHALDVLGGAAAAQGQRAAEVLPRLRRAARLFGATEALREAEGIARLPYFRPFHERGLATLRAQLDPAIQAAAWAEGRAMSLEEAIDYALEESTARFP